jgi:hypothetical protein
MTEETIEPLPEDEFVPVEVVDVLELVLVFVPVLELEFEFELPEPMREEIRSFAALEPPAPLPRLLFKRSEAEEPLPGT